MRLAVLATCLLAASTARAAETVLVLDGDVPADGPDHFFVPFDVPEGVVEIEVQHDDLSDDNVLDWGLDDPNGFRGWGGGNGEPAIVGVDAASRSYVAGPIPAGTWRVVVGKAKLAELPATYALSVTLRDAPTLAPQPERGPYAPVVLARGARWYAGDFHAHSRESGDARPPLDEIAAFARGRGLDFVAVTDHNTLTQLEFLADAQARHPALLLVPALEFTTYAGHANAIGATGWVDHKIGQPGVTIAAAAAAFTDQGAALSINHPVLDLGDVCIGCAWKHETPPGLAAVEVATGGLDKAGKFFTADAIKYWDALCGQGLHLAAIGGSDDHRAGVDLDAFQSPIGDPTTLVWADELSTAGLLAGIRAGRTVVKLQGPGDPMVELSADPPPAVDTITADAATLTITVTGAPPGSTVRLVRNGDGQTMIPVDADPFTTSVVVVAPAAGEDRWRGEAIVDGRPRTITSHLWLREDPDAEPTGGPSPTTGAATTDDSTSSATGSGDATGGAAPGDGQGCACDLDAAPPLGLLALVALARRRARRRPAAA